MDCENILKELVDKKFVIFTKRGNAAILAALKLVKHLGMKKVLIQDMGGWITYPQFIDKLKLEQVRIKTNHGLVEEVPDGDVLLMNSMAGYFALHDMRKVRQKAKNLFLINDVAGSIGTEEAKVGDLIIGSFGRWKPLNVEEGGFLATDNEDHFSFLKQFSEDINFEKLLVKLNNLQSKLKFFDEFSSKIKHDLKDFDVIHRDSKGVNVVVRFSDEEEKAKLINYCEKLGVSFEECPKYIRVLDQAISIEVKRIDN